MLNFTFVDWTLIFSVTHVIRLLWVHNSLGRGWRAWSLASPWSWATMWSRQTYGNASSITWNGTSPCCRRPNVSCFNIISCWWKCKRKCTQINVSIWFNSQWIQKRKVLVWSGSPVSKDLYYFNFNICCNRSDATSHLARCSHRLSPCARHESSLWFRWWDSSAVHSR